MILNILENHGHIEFVKEENEDWLTLESLEGTQWQCKRVDTKEANEETKAEFLKNKLANSC